MQALGQANTTPLNRLTTTIPTATSCISATGFPYCLLSVFSWPVISICLQAAQSATVLQLQQLIKAADDKLLQLGVQLSQMVQHNGNTAHPASSMTGNSDTDLKLARLQSVTRYECSRNLADAERDILLEHERKRAKLLYDATL